MNKGLAACVGASVSFGCIPFFSKNLTLSGMQPPMIIALTTLATFSFHFLRGLARREKREKLAGRQVAWLCGAGAGLMGMTTFLLSSSYQRIPTGTATIIHFLYPVVTIFVMAAFFGERITRIKAVAAVLAVAGMLMTTTVAASGDAGGYVLAALSSLTYTLYLVASQKACYAGVSTGRKMEIMALSACVFFFGAALASGEAALPATGVQWLCTLGMAACSCMGHTLLNYGVVRIGAVRAAFTTLLEPITAILAGVALLGEQFSARGLAGMAIILAAVFLCVRPQR